MAGRSDGEASGSSSAPGSQQSSSEPPAQQQQQLAELLDALGRSQLLEHAAAAFVLVPAVASKRRVQQEDMSQQPNGTTAASSPAAAAADAVASSGVLDNSRLIAAQAGIQLASGPCTQYFALWLAGARCALDAGLLPALERALRRPQLWPEAADCDPMLRTAETAAVLDLMTRGLRRSGAWPALVAHAPVHEVVGLVATVELLLKRTCPGTAWLRCLPAAFNQAVPEDARLLSNTVVALLEQLQQLQQPEPSAAPAGSTEKHDDEVAMAAAAETVAGRENSTSSARGENQVDRRSGAASRRPQQPSTVLAGCSTSSMEEFEDLAAMAGPLWYNNIDQQRSRDRMRLADLRWLPLLLEHASCAAFVAPPCVPVPVINGLSWTLAHRLAVVRLLLCLVGHVPDCMAARDEAQDAEEASAARLASESWHAALWGPCRTSTYGLVRNLLEGPAGPDDTEWPQGKAGEELELACLHLVEALIASRLWVPRPEAALSSGSDGGSNDRLVRKLRLLADRHGRHHLVDHIDATGQVLEAHARSAAGLGLSGTEDKSPVMERLLDVDPQQPRPALQQQMRAGVCVSQHMSTLNIRK
eukprot:XP_001701101.1 predicted protein [Chlamydomonas reinhardtii]